MSAVVEAARLAALIGLGLLFMLGQGWLVVGPVLHGSLTARSGDTRPLQEIPLSLLTGIMANYGLILVFQSLWLALGFGLFASILGLGFFAVHTFQHRESWTMIGVSIAKPIGAALVCMLYLGPILAEPLVAWDARSIWFFHAKMIYTAGSIGQVAGWQDAAVSFSHVDYPKLVPALAGQVAAVMGFWNEYIPKASLVFLLVPAMLWLFSFARPSGSFLVLLLMFPLGLSSWMWNGYMDGYLALYFAVGLLLLGRYRKSRQAIDMASAVCILLALPNIKNEGALAGLAGLPVVAWLLCCAARCRMAGIVSARYWRYYLAIIAGLLPIVLWSLYKRQWGLANDLEIGAAQSLTRLSSRLLDGSWELILARLWDASRGALLTLGLLSGAYIAWKRPFPRQPLPAVLAGSIYCLGIIAIYLLTPYSVIWQLDTSMERVALSVSACIFVAGYYLLDSLETEHGRG